MYVLLHYYRGTNVFRKKEGATNGAESWALIDWQMWAAGPPACEYSQAFLNSFAVETNVIQTLDHYVTIYYEALW